MSIKLKSKTTLSAIIEAKAIHCLTGETAPAVVTDNGFSEEEQAVVVMSHLLVNYSDKKEYLAIMIMLEECGYTVDDIKDEDYLELLKEINKKD